MAFFIWLLLLLSLSKFNSIPSFLFLNHLVSFKIQNFHSSIFCDIILCNDFSKFVVTEDSLQDKLETICMTANTVVNQSVFHFFKLESEQERVTQTKKNQEFEKLHLREEGQKLFLKQREQEQREISLNEKEENILHIEEEHRKKTKAMYKKDVIQEMEKIEVSYQKKRNAYEGHINAHDRRLRTEKRKKSWRRRKITTHD